MKDIMKFQARLLEMLAENQPLDVLMECCGEMFGNPVALLNAAYKPISAKMSEAVTDPIWNLVINENNSKYTISKGVCDVPYFMEIGRTIACTDEPFLFQNDEGKKSVIKRIVMRDKILGYFCCIEQERPFDEHILDSVKIVCNIFSVQLQKMDYFTLSASKPKDDLMKKLLESRDRHLLPYQDVLDTILNQQRGNYYILTIPAPLGDYSKKQLDNMCAQLSLADRECRSHAILYNHQIVVIVCMKDSVFEQYLYLISSYCRSYGMTGGLSEGFQDARHFQKYYAQAVSAMTLARYRPNNSVVSYADIRIYDMLSNIRPEVNRSGYCLDVVRHMKQYDEENHTNYLETLSAYLKLAGNITRVSECMHTHRNTIVHRLNRLTQLFPLNLEDGEELLRIFLSIRILEMESVKTGAEK